MQDVVILTNSLSNIGLCFFFPGSLDFPAVNASVHKDEVEMYFWHPYEIYEQDILYEEFKYTITHDQVRNSVLKKIKNTLKEVLLQ